MFMFSSSSFIQYDHRNLEKFMGIFATFFKEYAKNQALIPKLRNNLISCRGQNFSFSLYKK